MRIAETMEFFAMGETELEGPRLDIAEVAARRCSRSLSHTPLDELRSVKHGLFRKAPSSFR